MDFPSGLAVKKLSANAGDVVLIPEDSLEKEMAIHSNILAWKIPLTEVPGRLQYMGSQRVRHDWAHMHTHIIYSLYFKYPSRNTICSLIQKITFYFILEYSWLAMLCQFQISSKVIHVSILFLIIFPFRFFYNIEQNYLCYTVGTYWLFILHTAVCTCQL